MSLDSDIKKIANKPDLSAAELYRALKQMYDELCAREMNPASGKDLSDELTVRDDSHKPTAYHFAHLLWDFAEWIDEGSEYAKAEIAALKPEIEKSLERLKTDGWFPSKKALSLLYVQREGHLINATQGILIIDDDPGLRLRAHIPRFDLLKLLLTKYLDLESLYQHIPQEVGNYQLRESYITWILSEDLEA